MNAENEPETEGFQMIISQVHRFWKVIYEEKWIYVAVFMKQSL